MRPIRTLDTITIELCDYDALVRGRIAAEEQLAFTTEAAVMWKRRYDSCRSWLLRVSVMLAASLVALGWAVMR